MPREVRALKTRALAGELKLTSLPALEAAAECLKTLAHPHRLRIIQMLIRGRFSVGELAAACQIPSAMASEHLRLMQRCGVLKNVREGRKVYYRVEDPFPTKILPCLISQFEQQT